MSDEPCVCVCAVAEYVLCVCTDVPFMCHASPLPCKDQWPDYVRWRQTAKTHAKPQNFLRLAALASFFLILRGERLASRRKKLLFDLEKPKFGPLPSAVAVSGHVTDMEPWTAAAGMGRPLDMFWRPAHPRLLTVVGSDPPWCN